MSARARRMIAILLIAVALDLVVGFLNPFGIQDAVKARAAETLQLVAAPFYGAGRDTPGQKVVTVVLIDPAYFKAIRPDDPKPRWPMPVNLLTMGVIQRILDAGPKALFIDIAFPDAPREITDGSVNSRAEAITALAAGLKDLQGRVPIFLGDDIAPDRGQQKTNAACGVDFIPRASMGASSLLAGPLVKALFNDPHPALAPGQRPPPGIALVDASWSGRSDVYPLAPTLVGDDNCLGLLTSGQGFIPSPALALFKAYADDCPAERRLDTCSRPAFVRLRDDISVRGYPGADGLRLFGVGESVRRDMMIRWGVRLSDATKAAFTNAPGSDDCYEQFYPHGGVLDSLRNYLLHMIAPIERTMGRPDHRACVYIDTISAAHLLDRRRFSDASGAVQTDPDRIQQAFIKDRVVLLGVALPSSGDQFPSPINGSIPGVYIHAAALENLITSGDDFHVSESGTLIRLMVTLLGALLLWGMTWLWERLCERLSARYPGWGQHLLAPLSYGVILFVLGTLLILWLTAWTNLPLTEIAGPIVALHAILFAGMVANWRKALEARLGAAEGGRTAARG